jgi:multidrug efflux pump subunit AcrA (membrane-fusion protein)
MSDTQLISLFRTLAIGAVLITAPSLESFASTPVVAEPLAVVSGKAMNVEDISDVLSYPARLVPKVNSVVLAESDGVIGRIPVSLGERVHPRQTLIVLNHTDPIYKYAPLAAYSPIEGVISSIEVSEGAQVAKGQRLATVTDPRKLRVMIEVPAEDLASLKAGAAAELTIDGTATPMPVRLKGVSPFVDPNTGTASCEFALDTARYPIAPGVVGRLSLKVRPRKGIRIPEYAIIYRNQAPFARIFENGKIRFAAIKLGRKQEGQVEILGGILPNEILIERASRFVAEGEAVQLEQDKPASKPSGPTS